MITQENITFGIAIITAIFVVYNYFRNPQVDADKRDALMEQRLKIFMDASDKRFVDMGNRITEATALAQNHIHTIDTKVDTMGTNMNIMSNEITKLATIIDERIPKAMPGRRVGDIT